MTELELRRLPPQRRRYELAGVGTLQVTGLISPAATAVAGEDSWRFARRGRWRRGIQATDRAGAVVGEYEPRRLRSGGLLRWAGRDFALPSASRWRERYALVDADRELAVLEGKGWGGGRCG